MRSRVVIFLVGMGILLSFPQWSGAQWEQCGPEGCWIAALGVSGTNLFSSTAHGVFLSTNNGKSWTAVNTGLLVHTDVQCLTVSGPYLFASIGEWWHFITRDPMHVFRGVFLSTDNGTSWKEVNSGLPEDTWVLALAVSGTNIFAGTDEGGVFLSTNNGKSWTAVNSGLPEKTGVRCLTVSGSYLFVGTDGRGVWRLPLSDVSIETR